MMESEQVLQWIIAPLALGYGTFMLLIVNRIQKIKTETNHHIDLMWENFERKHGDSLTEFNKIKSINSDFQVDFEKRLSQFLKKEDLRDIINDIKCIKKSITNYQVNHEKDMNNYIKRDEFIAIITMLGERINKEKYSSKNKTYNKKMELSNK